MKKHLIFISLMVLLFTNTFSSAAGTSASGINIAKGKPAKQSSTGWGGSASRGVDGNPNGQYNANSVTHTNQDQNAWWEVDLQSVHVLNSINVYNRTDCCGERLNGFRVITSINPLPNKPLSNSEVNALRHWDVKTAGKVSRINLGNVSGRYVRIQLIGRNYLSLAEVEVFGQP
ncbi:discoidin domain-containing protein [Leucothrix mucor]|uniref:galactose-binding domain-containing protein n=1 Tax=Leucothrix mucor TaxID=45248 RepID=UPI0003B3AE56|nr:discoidin domain-containing protein [Leucothrix mucor]